MARSLRNAFLLVTFVVSPAAIVACSSTSSGTGASTTTTTTAHGGSTTTTTSGTTSSTTTTAAPACTDSADQAALASHPKVADDAKGCVLANLTDMTKVSPCIQMMDGLSKGCADCFAAEGSCGASNCLGPCTAPDGGALCSDCLAQHCDPAFKSCSGLDPAAAQDAGPG